MLRLTPTVTSLTTAEVTDLSHRLRFRRFLESDEQAGICWAPTMNQARSEAAFNIARFKRMPQPHSSTRDVSPPNNRSRPLVVDPPVILPPDQGIEEHIPPMLESSGRQEHGVKAEEEQRQGPAGTVQLCIRLRRSSLQTTTAADVMIGLAGATRQHISPESSMHNPSVNEAIMERIGVSAPSPSTPPRKSLPESGSQLPFPSAATPAAAFETQRRFRVYNDFLPASSQPQTPQNLPEARHQSRLLASFTAPAPRTSPHPTWTPTTSRSRRGFGRRREISPLGSRTPGSMGLYSGTENMDDGALIEETAEETPERGRSISRTSRHSGSA
ncbi:hypothetical protein C8A03DRAFT_14410 [Achaetomium macrosporum]|uniref:Uncharacterized protein n=1 Tax=Achaetomium macrosporum TaxID=79813 RepID=A0AAN7HER2_9PEZI|nr:hypothetical protein C8A03DRAFT_14410 [Achaetomium macrosporum]